jgi:hypothetical protein
MSSLLHHMIRAGGRDFTTCSPYLATQEGDLSLRMPGPPVVDMHHQLWASGSVGLW